MLFKKISQHFKNKLLLTEIVYSYMNRLTVFCAMCYLPSVTLSDFLTSVVQNFQMEKQNSP